MISKQNQIEIRQEAVKKLIENNLTEYNDIVEDLELEVEKYGGILR